MGPAAASLAPQVKTPFTAETFPDPRRLYVEAMYRKRAGVLLCRRSHRAPRPLLMRVAVVGHVEWIEFARVERVPTPGEIVHASDAWQEPGGGGAVAAVQLARLAGSCLFL